MAVLAHLLAAFRRLFSSRRSRLGVAGLIAVTAAVPLSEMLLLRVFTDLVIDGPARFADDPASAAVPVGLFLLAFAAARAAHHLVRLLRIRVFRRAFEESEQARTPSQESWEWALAFELSGVLVGLVQAVAFSLVVLAIDWPTGAVNVVVSAIALGAVSVIYRRQLDLQRDYVRMGSRPGTVAIAQRVGTRVRDAEVGSVLASVAMAVVVVVMLLRTLAGAISSADAIVLFLCLRLLSGQLGTLSAGTMRFARASARRWEGAAR